VLVVLLLLIILSFLLLQALKLVIHLMDPGLPPDYTGTAELEIEEEKNRRLAERVSKRIEAEAITKAMLKQIPARKLVFDDEPTNTGASSSSSGGLSGYIAGVPAVVGGAGKAARSVAGAVGALKPGEVVGTITGGTIGAAAIGVMETGRGIYHTGATAGGILLDYYLGGDGEEAQSAGSNPEPSRPKKKKIPSPPSSEGPPKPTRRRRGLLSLLPGEENAASKSQRSTRSGTKILIKSIFYLCLLIHSKTFYTKQY
jgi:hypothetical protein